MVRQENETRRNTNRGSCHGGIVFQKSMQEVLFETRQREVLDPLLEDFYLEILHSIILKLYIDTWNMS